MKIDCSKIPFQDKGCHAIVGFVIAVVVGIVVYIYGAEYPQMYGVVSALIAGIGKEVRDYIDYGKFDYFDMFATFVGGFFGGLVLVLCL